MHGRRNVPPIGAVVAGSTLLMPYVVVDGAGAGIDVVNRYLRDRMLGDVSPLTCRSYGYDLLRWFRLLWLLEVDWDKATEAETAVMIGWLRNAGNPQRTRRPGSPQPGSVNVRTGKPEPDAGYAPATIAHVLSVDAVRAYKPAREAGRCSTLFLRTRPGARCCLTGHRWRTRVLIAGHGCGPR